MERKEDMFGDAGDEPVEQAQEPAVEETPEPEPAVQPEPPAEEPPAQPVMVPLAALHEVRDEVKRLKEEREQSRQAPQPQPLPDWYEDPDARESRLVEHFQQALYLNNRNISERFARSNHGDELVNAAQTWAGERCNADPHFNMQVFQSPDPFGFVIEQYQRDQIAQQVKPEDFKAFQEWRAAQAQPQQPLAAPAIPASTPPPTSLVTAVSAGTPAPPKDQPEEQRLNAMFGG